MKRRFALAAALLLLTGCVSENLYAPAPGQKMRVSQRTFDAFKEYEGLIGSTRPGPAPSPSHRTARLIPTGIARIPIAPTWLPLRRKRWAAVTTLAGSAISSPRTTRSRSII